MDPSCFLTSSDFVCTVCIFSKAFEADHKSIGLPVKEAGLVYLLATATSAIAEWFVVHLYY